MNPDATIHDDLDRFVLQSLRRDKQRIFERGEGSRLWDVEGREYLDTMSGSAGPAMVGHAHPRVQEAVASQMATLPSANILHQSTPVIAFCKRMAEITPRGLTRTVLCAGGGEAIEAAIKFAMRVTGRPEVIALTGSYHGMSLALMTLGGNPALRGGVPASAQWPTFRQVPNADPYRPPLGPEGGWEASARALETAIDLESYGQVAALVMEVVQGPSGHVVFPAEYYAEVQRICRERGVLLIVDEIQTALARCGSMWAVDLFGLEPDILCVGKAFGGGVPFGAFVTRDELVSDDLESEPWHILTFMNQPLGAAAGLAVIEIVEDEQLVERARTLGDHATERFQAMADRYEVIGDVRGPGLFIGLDFVEDRDSRTPATVACGEAWEFALDRGLLAQFGGAGNVLKFKPPLTVPESDFEQMLDLVDETAAFIEQRVHSRTPARA